MNLPRRFESIRSAIIRIIKKGTTVKISLNERKRQAVPKSFQNLIVNFTEYNEAHVFQ